MLFCNNPEKCDRNPYLKFNPLFCLSRSDIGVKNYVCPAKEILPKIGAKAE